MDRVGWAGGPDLDCIDAIEDEQVPLEWSPDRPRVRRPRDQTSNYEKMEADRRQKKIMSDARLQCGGTPTGYTTLKTSGITRIPTSSVVRQLDYSTPPPKPRNPLRYMKKRMNEGMGCLQRASCISSPGYCSPSSSLNYCEACGGPRRCYPGVDNIDPNCHPRVSPPKYPDFDSPSAYEELANMKQFLANDENYM